MEKENQLLIDGLRSGDKKVFKTIFDNWYQPIVRFCMQRTGNQEDAEEIAQDIFVKLWTKRDQMQINTSLSGYLYRSALNQIINNAQHQKVKLSHQEHVMAKHDETPYQTDHFTEKEISTIVSNTVAQMPEKRRMVYQMSRKQGLKYAEIAQKMDISVKTVEAHLSAALSQLRITLKDFISMIIFTLINFF